MNGTTMFKYAIVLIAFAALFACGGGGSGNGASPFVAGLVFKADKDTDGTEELYAASADGTQAIKLSGSLAADFVIDSYQVSEDRQYVAYVVTDNSQLYQISKLYVVNVNGGTPIRVSGIPTVTGSLLITNFVWSPDGMWLAYRGIQDTQGKFELYTVRSDGSENVKISMDAQNNIKTDFKWAPDSSRIAYRTSLSSILHTVQPDGLNNIEISGSLVLNGAVYENFRWSPDSLRVAYRADQDIDGVVELYISLANGGSNIQVSSVISDASSTAELVEFKWSPDGTRIAYIANHDIWYRHELYVALSDGSNSNKVSGVVVNTTDVNVASNFKWSPDSSSLAYQADLQIDRVHDLYTVNANGSNNIKVSTTLKPPVGNIFAGGRVRQFMWAPDNSRIAYVAVTNLEIINVFRLYTVKPDGTENTEVSGAMPLNGGVGFAKWSPDSTWLAYDAQQEAYDINGYILPRELYSVRFNGTGNSKVSGTMPTNPNVFTLTGNVIGYAWRADSQQLLYRADQSIDEQFELYTGQADGSGDIKISGPLVDEGDVLGYVLIE